MKRIPFDERELQAKGFLPPNTVKPANVPLLRTPIAPRENFRCLLDRQTPLWIPLSTDIREFCANIIPDNVCRYGVREADQTKFDAPSYQDMFGITWEHIPQVGGSMVMPGKPLFEDANDWRDYVKFPDIEVWDWKGCAKRNQRRFFDTEFFTQCWIFNGLFERLISFMDAENALVAMVDEEQTDALKELLDSLCTLYENIIDHYVDYFHMDSILFHDDWGSQRAPLFSLETCRAVLVPHLKRLVDHCHKRGVLFNLHSCGKNELLVPAMIEAGVDIWEGQSLNDFDMLYKTYGDQIILGMAMENIGQDAPDEMADAKAKQLVEKYSGTLRQKPFFVGCRGLFNLKQRESIYKYSRLALN